MNETRKIPAMGLVALAALAACAQPSGPGKLVQRESPAAQPAAAVVPGADPELRHYGRGQEEARQPVPPSGPQQLADLIDYDLPPGWELLEPNNFRFINLRPGGDPDSECYVSVLPSDGGGLGANVNRWRGQLGLPDLAAAEIEALPRRPLLTGEGVLVDFTGAYAGMSGASREGWRMIGLIVPIPGQTLFVKMTGPADVMADEADNFEVFCDSLRPGARVTEIVGQGSAQDGTGGASGLVWTAPAGWVDQGPRTMRLVSYQVGANTECYLALARGEALTNYNRWRGQVGLPPMSAEVLEALETMDVLGTPCRLLDVTGEFRGMSGDVQPDTTLLGLMRPLAGDSLFVKMVGPAAEVAAARADFAAFCGSIAEE